MSVVGEDCWLMVADISHHPRIAPVPCAQKPKLADISLISGVHTKADHTCRARLWRTQ